MREVSKSLSVPTPELKGAGLVTFQGPDLPAETILRIHEMTKAFQGLEDTAAKSQLDMCYALKRIHDELIQHKETNNPRRSAWNVWLENFMYTEDWATRMVRTAEVASKMDLETLPPGRKVRHLREIGRLVTGQADMKQLATLAETQDLRTEALRLVVNKVNREGVSVADAVQSVSKLKDENTKRVPAATRDAQNILRQIQRLMVTLGGKPELLARRIESVGSKDLRQDVKNALDNLSEFCESTLDFTATKKPSKT